MTMATSKSAPTNRSRPAKPKLSPIAPHSLNAFDESPCVVDGLSFACLPNSYRRGELCAVGRNFPAGRDRQIVKR